MGPGPGSGVWWTFTHTTTHTWLPQTIWWNQQIRSNRLAKPAWIVDRHASSRPISNTFPSRTISTALTAHSICPSSSFTFAIGNWKWIIFANRPPEDRLTLSIREPLYLVSRSGNRLNIISCIFLSLIWARTAATPHTLNRIMIVDPSHRHSGTWSLGLGAGSLCFSHLVYFCQWSDQFTFLISYESGRRQCIDIWSLLFTSQSPFYLAWDGDVDTYSHVCIRASKTFVSILHVMTSNGISRRDRRSKTHSFFLLLNSSTNMQQDSIRPRSAQWAW